MTQVKNLGRQVENFDDEIWTQKCEDIVYEANLAKFKQNLDMKKILLQTGEHILAVIVISWNFRNPVFRKLHDTTKFGELEWDLRILEYKILTCGLEKIYLEKF